jgi:hypothetical protein
MPEIQDHVDKLISTIDKSISDFNKGIPIVQKAIFDDLQVFIKDLEISGGKITNSVENFNLLRKLKAKIDKIILTDEYKKNVASFAKSFDTISQIHDGYFSAMVGKFTRPKVLKAIREENITNTIKSLTESGISDRVSEGIKNILRTNITSGAKYSDLVDQMRQYMTTNGSGLGALEKYASQITTDSINQYSAQYNETISADLGLKWRRYTGSNLETSRELCVHLSKKEFYHVSELPEIIKGKIDGESVAINPKTDLWYGAIPGTNEENFKVRRGGYRCGHQDLGVSEIMVPKFIRINTYTKLRIKFNDNGMAVK